MIALSGISNPGPDDYRSDAVTTELYRHLCNKPKSLRFIVKHRAREYQEKTTPSRIFMLRNLNSCRVLENPRVTFTLEFQQGKDKMFRFILYTPCVFFSWLKNEDSPFHFLQIQIQPLNFFQGSDHP